MTARAARHRQIMCDCEVAQVLFDIGWLGMTPEQATQLLLDNGVALSRTSLDVETWLALVEQKYEAVYVAALKAESRRNLARLNRRK